MADNYFSHRGSGLRNVGSYQASGWPWVTGSADLDNNEVHLVEFPMVTRSFTVINNTTATDSEIRVHFNSGSGVTAVTEAGSYGAQTIADTANVIKGFHYVSVPYQHGSVTLNAKVRKIYISNGSGDADLKYTVFAELTGIGTGSYPNSLSGSGITADGGAGDIAGDSANDNNNRAYITKFE